VSNVVPTYQDAEIILKLYEQFESDRLCAAKKWFASEWQASTYEEFIAQFPRGSEGFSRFLTLYGFFEMVGVLHKNGLVHPDLLFDMWYINGFYSKLYPIIDGWRKKGDAHVAENFELLALAELEWIGKVKGEQYVPDVPYARKTSKSG
jgi:hypothetical protein